MDFTTLTTEQRTACARLFGAILGSIRALPRDEFGETSQLALTYAYKRASSIVNELWDELEQSYPPAAEDTTYVPD